MINNDTMYGFYKETLKHKYDTIIKACIITDLEQELMIELLQDIKKFHPEHRIKKTILDFSDIEIQQLKVNKSQLLFINNYITTYKTIQGNKIKAKEECAIKLTNNQFSFILATFNRLLWKAIIEEAYIFKHNLIGRIYAVCRKNESCKPKMNWKASLINRQAIIDKGGIPRVELDARRADFYNQTYEGEKWVETHEPFNVAIVWKRTAYSVSQIPTSKDYAIKLVKSATGDGVIAALKDMRDNNRLDDLIIKYQRNHG